MLSPQAFRTQMAEQGYEYTVDQASKILRRLISLNKRLKRRSDLSLMSSQEKQRSRTEAAEHGIEISPDEFNQLHDLLVKIQQADFEAD
jgi:LDH2 family malate/lactate/ureidoglycolate dehydrogenase